jgi:hypothetical protein
MAEKRQNSHLKEISYLPMSQWPWLAISGGPLEQDEYAISISNRKLRELPDDEQDERQTWLRLT